MTTRPLPRLRDPISLAKLIGDIATGLVEDAVDNGKDAAAVAMGHKGEAARAATMTPEKRAKIAKKASKRWARDR